MTCDLVTIRGVPAISTCSDSKVLRQSERGRRVSTFTCRCLPNFRSQGHDIGLPRYVGTLNWAVGRHCQLHLYCS